MVAVVDSDECWPYSVDGPSSTTLEPIRRKRVKTGFAKAMAIAMVATLPSVD